MIVYAKLFMRSYYVIRMCFYFSIVLLAISFLFQNSDVTFKNPQLVLALMIIISISNSFSKKITWWQTLFVYLGIFLPIDWVFHWLNLEEIHVSYATFLWILLCESLLIGLFFLFNHFNQNKNPV